MDVLAEANKLQENRLLRNEEEIINFEEAIENILNMKNVKHIKHLCAGFDDNTEDSEVMFGLIHAIESYDTTAGVRASLTELAKSITLLIDNAIEWGLIIHKRILNDPSSLESYASVIKKNNLETKDAIVDIMKNIEKDNPENFKNKVQVFLNYL